MNDPLRRRLEDEVAILEPIYGPVIYDQLGWRWIMIPQFPIPLRLGRPCCAVLIELPRSYPAVPPHGVYLDRDLNLDSHFFAYSRQAQDYTRQGWGWLCLHENPDKPSAWRPTACAARGDNLNTLLLLVSAMLDAL